MFTEKIAKAKCLTSAPLHMPLSLKQWFGHAIILHQVSFELQQE